MPFTVGSMGKVALVDLYNEKKKTQEKNGETYDISKCCLKNNIDFGGRRTGRYM